MSGTVTPVVYKKICRISESFRRERKEPHSLNGGKATIPGPLSPGKKHFGTIP
jgi:hypothetical protein